MQRAVLAVVTALATAACGHSESSATGNGPASAGAGGVAAAGSGGAPSGGTSASGGASASAGATGTAGAAGAGAPLSSCTPGSCGAGQSCIEGCPNSESPGGVCSVAGRDGCGCGAALDVCDTPGLGCLMPSCCEAAGLCVTPEERARICAGPEASRFDCSGQEQALQRAACNLYTGVERYGIYQADLIGNVCTQIIVAQGMANSSSISVTPNWAVERVLFTNSAADCKRGAQAQDAWVEPDAATGSIALNGSDAGWPVTSVDVNVILDFTSTEAWVPSRVEVVASGLPTETATCD